MAQSTGTCTPGRAEANLDVNNVKAVVFNTGTLFYGNNINGNGYIAPQSGTVVPMYAAAVWVGGEVNGELHVAAATYAQAPNVYNFWPGPMDSTTGLPVNPANCSAYDRIYSVYRSDIEAFEAGDPASEDLAEWPFELGAPVIDGDDDPNNYNLAGGDRPDIVGDQALFWVMNDVGGPHTSQGTPPLGIEVQVLAFSFSRSDAIGSTTFYRYRIINKGSNLIENTYVSVWADPDLGEYTDDYVGFDNDLRMAYVYNSDDEDTGGYGTAPPALGVDFFQGPIIRDEAGTPIDTLGATGFMYFSNEPGPLGDPDTGIEYYNFMTSRWGDGVPLTVGGRGRAGDPGNTGEITAFAYQGDPVTGEFWSERNIDGTGTANTPSDRRFLTSTGPFTMRPGDVQDIVFGIVFARGNSNLNSITALRAADALAQNAYDADFNLPPPPPPPPLCSEATSGSGQCFEAVELDGRVVLVWGYPPSSSNYLGRYDVQDPFLAGQPVEDGTYSFEGFNIYRYSTRDFEISERQLIATFDIVNGVTRVVDYVTDPITGEQMPILSADGSDSGIQYSLQLDNLTNYTDYYYGITAYAYNAESTPQVLQSSATLLTVRPANLVEGVTTQSATGDSLVVTATNLVGGGTVSATVADPTRITGDPYEVRFFRALDANGTATQTTVYSIVNTATGETRFDGQAYFLANGAAPPIGQNVQIVDGFSYSIQQPTPDFTAFQVVQNAAGTLSPPIGGAAAAPVITAPDNQFPIGEAAPPGPGQQSTNSRVWLFHTGGAYETYADFLSRTFRIGTPLDNRSTFGFFDYEMRFTGQSIGRLAFQGSGTDPITVPFELWNIGEGTPDDPSDDYRMIPYVFDNETTAFPDGDGIYNISGDHLVSPGAAGGFADPYTDWVYWMNPVDVTPGQSGYLAYAGAGTPDLSQVGEEAMARTVLVVLNTNPAQNATLLPEPGTIFRITSQKGIGPGSVFTIDTSNRQLTAATDASREEALEQIQIVPNPYMGSSSYETGNTSRVIRFTNLPPQATTIRIYTVAGTLVKTLQKEGNSRSFDWNLETENDLPVASGMYFVHVDVENVGERILKLGVVQRRTSITVF